MTAAGDSVSLLTVQMQQADLYTEAGRYKEAAEMYRAIIPHKDKLRNTELANQLDELRTLFEVDKLTLRNEVITTRLYLSLIIVALLLVAVILYIIYTRRLRRKTGLCTTPFYYTARRKAIWRPPQGLFRKRSLTARGKSTASYAI